MLRRAHRSDRMPPHQGRRERLADALADESQLLSVSNTCDPGTPGRRVGVLALADGDLCAVGGHEHRPAAAGAGVDREKETVAHVGPEVRQRG